MAHFAKLENNIVAEVIVINNNELLDENGNEIEEKGIQFCQNLFGGIWKQTSYNGSFRKNYAGIGYIYDEVRDAFISPKEYDSWVLNEETCQWEAPTPRPDDGKKYYWDEPTLSWLEMIEEQI